MSSGEEFGEVQQQGKIVLGQRSEDRSHPFLGGGSPREVGVAFLSYPPRRHQDLFVADAQDLAQTAAQLGLGQGDLAALDLRNMGAVHADPIGEVLLRPDTKDPSSFSDQLPNP